MNQLAIDFDPPRARRSDPVTSHLAAARAASFAETHAGRIHVALCGMGRATARDLSAATGLSVEQCCRRLPEMQKENLAAPVSVDGVALIRDGFRVWSAVK